jgi:peptide chain release factor 3
MGQHFQGVYNIFEKKISLFRAHGKQQEGETTMIANIHEPSVDKLLGERPAKELREEMETVFGVYPSFDKTLYQEGKQSPVFLEVQSIILELKNCWIVLFKSHHRLNQGRRKKESSNHKKIHFQVSF